jgi:hypothetical protein
VLCLCRYKFESLCEYSRETSAPMFQYSVFSGFSVFFESGKEKKICVSCGTVLTVHRLRKAMEHHEFKRTKFLILHVIYETT